MKIVILILFFTGALNIASAQIDAGSLMGIPAATTSEILAVVPTQEGVIAYSSDDDVLYKYTSSLGWILFDNQTASEVNFDIPTDVDGDGANETTVQEVIEGIAPITSASGRIFYPPSIVIDASTNGTGKTVNLYQEYINQFGVGNPNLIRSINGGTVAPNIPVYAANELYYYVTFFDPSVFANLSIDGATGIMSYDIIDQPADFNSLINIVFVVK